MNNLGLHLKEYRKTFGMTQRELARKLKLTTVTLCNLENDKIKAGPKVMRAVAKYFKLDIVEVVKMNDRN